jgi:hypothetical protein
VSFTLLVHYNGVSAMETFESALKVIKPFSYFASIDFRHAYFSLNMAENDQKFLRFQWREKIYQNIGEIY